MPSNNQVNVELVVFVEDGKTKLRVVQYYAMLLQYIEISQSLTPPAAAPTCPSFSPIKINFYPRTTNVVPGYDSDIGLQYTQHGDSIYHVWSTVRHKEVAD